jgi:hypothetical protein
MSKFLFGLVLFVSLFVSACSTPLPLDVAPDGGELVSTLVAPTPTVTPAVVPVVVPVVPVVPAVPAEGSVEVEPVTPSEGTGVVVE